MSGGHGVIEHDELVTLVPHKGKMFLLSRVTAWDLVKHTLRSEYDITENCLFYDEHAGGVPAWVSFELMAQSISALSGIGGRERGEKPKTGFILSVSNMAVTIPVLKAGTTVTMEIGEDFTADSIFVYHCAAFQGQDPVMEAKLTVMETEDLSELKSRIGGL
jgi:predicted hotdog family 3-hydroxylacyl-ACP dehydratase